MTRGVSIANNGSMPFDGWAHIRASAWNSLDPQQNSRVFAYINDVRVIYVDNAYISSGNSENSCDLFIPVKTGDIFKWTESGINTSSRGCTCILYPYEALPYEETEV